MRSINLWLLLAATYGLVNSNSRWQVQSENIFFELGLKQCQKFSQLFYKLEKGKLFLLVLKIVDDIKAARIDKSAHFLSATLNKKFELGTVTGGPGRMRFFDTNTVQSQDMTVATDADDKLNGLMEYALSCPGQKQFDQPINELERSLFASTNSSLGWIGTAASPFCSFYASYLQQKTPETKICHLVEQQNAVRKLKKLGTVINYPRPNDTLEYELSVLVFADASKGNDHGQFGVLTGLLVGELKNNSIYHPISWLSHKSKRPVKSVPAAEILASAEAIDEAKSIAHAYSEILDMYIRVHLCVDSKDLFTSLSTQRNSIDRSIRGDVASIRFEFQVGKVNRIKCITGKINLADVLTKKDSPLTDDLQLTLFTGRLNISFEDFAESKSTEKNYG